MMANCNKMMQAMLPAPRDEATPSSPAPAEKS